MVSPEGDLYHHLASVETHLEDVGVYGMNLAMCVSVCTYGVVVFLMRCSFQ